MGRSGSTMEIQLASDGAPHPRPFPHKLHGGRLGEGRIRSRLVEYYAASAAPPPLALGSHLPQKTLGEVG